MSPKDRPANPHTPPARQRLAEAVRSFAAGQMRSDEFRRIAWDAGFADRDIEPLHEEALHYLYDDIIPHYLRGRRRLDASARHMLARVVLFLQTDQRYEPVDDDELATAFGGSGIWPFRTNKEFAAAKATPRYLTGRNDRTPELTHAH